MKMSKTLKIILCACLLCTFVIGPLEAKKDKVIQKPVYLMGVGISFTDSLVFITDMMQVDSITLDRKKKFLMDRQLYSFQLQRYLEATYKGGPYVTAIFFSPSRKRMERRYLSMHKRYAGGEELRMILVDRGQFRFKPEKYIEVEEQPASPSKKKK